MSCRHGYPYVITFKLLEALRLVISNASPDLPGVPRLLESNFGAAVSPLLRGLRATDER
jgi:hypothetical protein